MTRLLLTATLPAVYAIGAAQFWLGSASHVCGDVLSLWGKAWEWSERR